MVTKSTLLSKAARELMGKLSRVAKAGPVQGVGTGAPAVGMTLLKELGIPYDSTKKPSFEGVVVTARRGSRMIEPNRVNLFAKVPDWKSSACKSSREVMDKYGYDRDGARRLYCTVTARRPNSQGLYLKVSRGAGILEERASLPNGKDEPVVRWSLADLRSRLLESHPESIWVSAVSTYRGNKEFFHYRQATYCGAPDLSALEDALEEGTITLDHLIMANGKSVTEKGPLFKIKPSNVQLLFPVKGTFDLLMLD